MSKLTPEQCLLLFGTPELHSSIESLSEISLQGVCGGASPYGEPTPITPAEDCSRDNSVRNTVASPSCGTAYC